MPFHRAAVPLAEEWSNVMLEAEDSGLFGRFVHRFPSRARICQKCPLAVFGNVSPRARPTAVLVFSNEFLRNIQPSPMNKRENPYTPGAGRKPRVLAGRDPDLENVQALIERLSGDGYERSVVYSGLRGVGKTVLLMEFDA